MTEPTQPPSTLPSAQLTQTAVYEETRTAWREIWVGTEFDQELASLQYARSQELLNLYLPFMRTDAPILEAGCGPGHVVYYLRERGFPALGLDYAPEALIPVLQRLPDLPLQVGDVHALPYAENTFSGYLSFGVVEHFVHGPQPTLREAFRVLQRGGTLVLTVPHPQFVEALYQLRNQIRPSKVARAGYYERTYAHQELAAHVRAVGFNIQQITPIGHSYTFYGLHPAFRQQGGYYEVSPLAETFGKLGKAIFPWQTAFQTLIIAHKP